MINRIIKLFDKLCETFQKSHNIRDLNNKSINSSKFWFNLKKMWKNVKNYTKSHIWKVKKESLFFLHVEREKKS